MKDQRLNRKWLIILTLWLAVLSSGQRPQTPELVDEFGAVTNDGLMARVDQFQLETAGSKRIAVLYGDSLSKYLNQRRIEGCIMWRKYEPGSIGIIFDKGLGPVKVQFWKVPHGVDLAGVSPEPIDFRLDDLRSPFELTTSRSTNEYCPRRFDLDWYASFMRANPTFVGKVVIDTSKRDFLRRVGDYRGQLAAKGVVSSRVRYVRQRFTHERDEQWWLVPPTRK